MNWLAGQLKNLDELAFRHLQYKELVSAGADGAFDAEKSTREAFHAAIRNLIGEIAKRPGVVACFAAHDGLPLDSAGVSADFDALAAMAQSCLDAGAKAAIPLQLGSMRQMLIIGEQNKLVLFAVNQIAVGIVAPSDTSLAESFGR